MTEKTKVKPLRELLPSSISPGELKIREFFDEIFRNLPSTPKTKDVAKSESSSGQGSTRSKRYPLRGAKKMKSVVGLDEQIFKCKRCKYWAYKKATLAKHRRVHDH